MELIVCVAGGDGSSGANLLGDFVYFAKKMAENSAQ